MQIVEDKLFALDESGKLSVWDTSSLQKTYSSKDTIIQFTSIGVDKNNQVFLGSRNGELFKLNNKDFTTELYLKYKKGNYAISEIFFNSSNELFLILPIGIYDPINDVLWEEFDHKNSIIRVIDRKRFLFFFHKKIILDHYFAYPDYSFLDSNDIIWMSKPEGEFGSQSQVFDTKKREIIRRDYEHKSHPNGGFISGFENEKGDIFITTENRIFNIKNSKRAVVFESSSVEGTSYFEFKDDAGNIFLLESSIGAGTFNEKEQKIYFVSTKGIYSAEISEDGNVINPKLVLSPIFKWKYNFSVFGFYKEIKKIAFAKNNKLFFLTLIDGIGVYDGDKVIILK